MSTPSRDPEDLEPDELFEIDLEPIEFDPIDEVDLVGEEVDDDILDKFLWDIVWQILL